MNGMAARVAGEREAGAVCPGCGAAVPFGGQVAVCTACGSAHHRVCWDAAGRCGSYECAPARRDLPAAPAPALRISATELAATPAPVPAAPAVRPVYLYAGPPPAPPRRPRWSRLAITSLVLAIAGIPLFGLVTGLVAVVVGCVALGSLTARGQRGLGLALVGIVLGLADAVGWGGALYVLLGQPGGGIAHIGLSDFDLDLKSFDGLNPKIGRAMRANVLIKVQPGWGRLGFGSGIVLKRDGGDAIVLTNRHVVDPDFDAAPLAVGKGDAGALQVQLVGQPSRPGTLVWVAPADIDLAVVRVPWEGDEARTTLYRPGRPARVGDAVFAIGNPQGLGWTHTQGTISQFRTQNVGGHKLRLIQTQTAANPGNSGGGLYDADGYLIGVVTMKVDRNVAEGLNFAISLDALPTLLPADLQPAAEADAAP